MNLASEFKTTDQLSLNLFICKNNFSTVLIKTIRRKHCINETEEFDFLKDIVESVEKVSMSASLVEHPEEEKSIVEETVDDVKFLEPDCVETGVDEESKVSVSKCTISSILNEDSEHLSSNQTETLEQPKIAEGKDA
jgi:hypothetical protein